MADNLPDGVSERNLPDNEDPLESVSNETYLDLFLEYVGRRGLKGEKVEFIGDYLTDRARSEFEDWVLETREEAPDYDPRDR